MSKRKLANNIHDNIKLMKKYQKQDSDSKSETFSDSDSQDSFYTDTSYYVSDDPSYTSTTNTTTDTSTVNSSNHDTFEKSETIDSKLSGEYIYDSDDTEQDSLLAELDNEMNKCSLEKDLKNTKRPVIP